MLRTVTVALVALGAPATAQNRVFVTQFGTSLHDRADAAAPDGLGGAFVAGVTEGALAGPLTGMLDVWVARVDGLGKVLWSDQFGSTRIDFAEAAAADGMGGVFVGGATAGSIGAGGAGEVDAWIARYDAGGARLWLRQFGSVQDDVILAATSDGSGGLYVGGQTTGDLFPPSAGHYDAWVSRFDSSGTQLWVRQLGTAFWDGARAMCGDGAGGVFVAGTTYGNLAGTNLGLVDAWIARYDPNGSQLWIRQLGSAGVDVFNCLAADSGGGAFVGGSSDGSLFGPNVGYEDVVLARYDAGGNRLWASQFGSARQEQVETLTLDPSAGVLASGWTFGDLAAPSAGNLDVWLARYDAAGSRQWILQDGSTGPEYSAAAAPVGLGGVILVGATIGSWGGPCAGLGDVLLMRYEPAPVTYCVAKTQSLGCVPAIDATGIPSASQTSGFVVTCSSVQNQKPGLLIYTTQAARSAIAFQCGTLCVEAQSVRRSPSKSSGGNPPPATDCSGVHAIDVAAFAVGLGGGNPDPGLSVPATLVHAQWWGRDQGFAPPCNATLSDGLEYVVGP